MCRLKQLINTKSCCHRLTMPVLENGMENLVSFLKPIGVATEGLLLKGPNEGSMPSTTLISTLETNFFVSMAFQLRTTFDETMKLIKERLAYVAAMKDKQNNSGEQPKRGLRRLSLAGVKPRRQTGAYSKQVNDSDGNIVKPAHLTLTFRTLEERLRKLRLKAGRGDGNLTVTQHNTYRPGMDRPPSKRSMQPENSVETTKTNQVDHICVEMKSLHNTMFVILRNQDKENPPFRIQIRSINHIVFYRQRGCVGHLWNQLMPGECLPYSWVEPMKSKKLTVRVAAKTQDVFEVDCQASSQHDSISDIDAEYDLDTDVATSADQEKHSARAARLKQALADQFVDTEERGGYGPSITVRLEEIGYRNFLPVPSKESGRHSLKRRKYLNCEVDTDGGTRLLVVSDDSGSDDERSMLNRHLETLRKQISYEQQRAAGLYSLRYALSQKLHDDTAKQKRSAVGESSDESVEGKSHAQAERDAVIETEVK